MTGSCLCGAVGFEVDGEGTPITRSEIDRVEIPAGAIDGDPGTRPGCHIFVRSKASWFPLSNSLPRFDEGPSRPSRG